MPTLCHWNCKYILIFQTKIKIEIGTVSETKIEIEIEMGMPSLRATGTLI
jgi:hypothetical protein